MPRSRSNSSNWRETARPATGDPGPYINGTRIPRNHSHSPVKSKGRRSGGMETSDSTNSPNSLNESPEVILNPALETNEYPAPPPSGSPSSFDTPETGHIISYKAELQGRSETETHSKTTSDAYQAIQDRSIMERFLESVAEVSDASSDKSVRTTAKTSSEHQQVSSLSEAIDTTHLDSALGDVGIAVQRDPGVIVEADPETGAHVDDDLPNITGHSPESRAINGSQLHTIPLPIWTDESQPLLLDTSIDSWLSSAISRLLRDHSENCRHNQPSRIYYKGIPVAKEDDTRALLLLLNPSDSCRRQAYKDLLTPDHHGDSVEDATAILQDQTVRNIVLHMMPLEMQSHPAVQRWFGPLAPEIIDLWNALQALKAVARIRSPEPVDEDQENQPIPRPIVGTPRRTSRNANGPITRTQVREPVSEMAGVESDINTRFRAPGSDPAVYRTGLRARGGRRWSETSDTQSPSPIRQVTRSRRSSSQEIDPEVAIVANMQTAEVEITQVNPPQVFSGFLHYYPSEELPFPSHFWHEFEFTSLSHFTFDNHRLWVASGTSLELRCGRQDYHYHSVANASELHYRCSHHFQNTSSYREIIHIEDDNESPSRRPLPPKSIDSPESKPRFRPSSSGLGLIGRNTISSRAPSTGPRPIDVPDIKVDSPGGTSSIVRQAKKGAVRRPIEMEDVWPSSDVKEVKEEGERDIPESSASGAMRYALS